MKASEPFSVRGALSADYSLQFMIGWKRFHDWKNAERPKTRGPDKNKHILMALPGRKVVFRHSDDETEENRRVIHKVLEQVTVEEEPLRAGPPMKYH